MRTVKMRTVKITIPTVDELQKNGFILYGYKAVQSSDKAGRPLVWTRNEYGPITTVEWPADLEAFASTDTIEKDQVISRGSEKSMSSGQIWTIDNTLKGPVTHGGTPEALSIKSRATRSLTCGLSQKQGKTFQPYCAFPLFANFLDTITPLDKVLLAFSTKSMELGTVVEGSLSGTVTPSEALSAEGAAWSPGIFIDLTEASERQVKFDLQSGWSWGGETWADTVSNTQDVVPLLIEVP